MKAVAAILGVLAMSGGAWAQSLLGEGGRSPYDPPKRLSYRKHDHVQIAVQERSRALSTADLKTDRRSRWETQLDKWVKFDRDKGSILPSLSAAQLADDPGIDLDSRYRQDNSGRTSRQFDLSFMITAEVIDVRPNGTLVLQAMKHRSVNSDDEIIKLTGEVSPSAIVNGSIRSDSIVNLNITYEGTGSVSDQTRQGWLGWLLSKLWPF